jgi:hypothetical protein
MPKILCGAKCECLVLCLPNDYYFSLTSKVFFTMLHIQLDLLHPLALGLSYYICGQPLDLMGIPWWGEDGFP